MTPTLAGHNLADMTAQKAELLREFPERGTVRTALAQVTYLTFGESSTRMAFATPHLLGGNVCPALLTPERSSFGRHVGHVVFMGAEPEMPPARSRDAIDFIGTNSVVADTRAIVAGMADGYPVREDAIDDLISAAMGAKTAPSSVAHEIESTVASAVDPAQPQPTIACSINERPESRDVLWGILGVHHSDLLLRSGGAMHRAVSAAPVLCVARELARGFEPPTSRRAMVRGSATELRQQARAT